MKPLKNIFKISDYPPIVISITTAAVSLILPFLLVGIFYLIGILIGNHNEALGNFLAYLLTGISVAIMCFYICKAHPRSFWYVPIVCNAITIWAGIGNYLEGNPNIILPFAIGWGLSIGTSVWGRNIGLRTLAKTRIH